MLDDFVTGAKALRNPKRVLSDREDAAMGESDPKKGTDKGDIPGPNVDFFKSRDRSKDAAGLAKALKDRK